MGRKVVVDESFVDFADSGDRFTLLDENYLRENPHLTVLRSISKSYGIPGCRIGLAASGDEARMSLLRKSFPVWNINSFGEFFLQIFDKYKEDYYKSCNQIAAERNRFFALLAAIPGLIAYPSAANYIMCRIDFGKISAHDLATKLLDENGILIKDLTSKAGFDNGEYIRVAVKNREDNNYILSQLAKILS